MSLRTRIAAAAALAVALVVVIAAVAIYLGVRAELRGEVDDSLRQRAEAISLQTDGRGRGDGPGEPGGGAHAGHRPPRLPTPRPEPFGGPEGFFQVVLPSGQVLRGPDASETLPVD
jgi:hypothetical protein